MKRRIVAVAAMLLVALAVPVNLPASEGACGCGPDFSKRAGMQLCRAVRAALGHSPGAHAAYRACVVAVKACEKAD